MMTTRSRALTVGGASLVVLLAIGSFQLLLPDGKFEFTGALRTPEGVPISGATVQYEFGHLVSQTVGVPMRHVRGTAAELPSVTTGDRGEFRIEGDGSELWKLRFEKPGFVFEKYAWRDFDVSSRAHAALGFVGWPTREADAVGGPDQPLRIQVSPGGGTYRLRLESGRELQGDPLDADIVLEVAIQRSEPRNWSLSIEAIRGGIQPSGAFQPGTAPSEGYAKQWKHSWDGGPMRSKNLVNTSFYVICHDRSVYAQLQLTFRPFASPGPYLEVHYRSNRHGRPNLRHGGP